jgi:hypothetical protein
MVHIRNREIIHLLSAKQVADYVNAQLRKAGVPFGDDGNIKGGCLTDRYDPAEGCRVYTWACTDGNDD